MFSKAVCFSQASWKWTVPFVDVSSVERSTVSTQAINSSSKQHYAKQISSKFMLSMMKWLKRKVDGFNHWTIEWKRCLIG
jgi:hypothetical protein